MTTVLLQRLSRPDAADLGRPASTVDTAALHTERLTVQARLDELVDLHLAGAITGGQLQRGTAAAREQLDRLDQRLAAAVTSTALDGVVGPDVEELWPTLDLSRRRAIFDLVMAVMVHRGRRGRPPGWRPGEPYFDPSSVEITWKGGER